MISKANTRTHEAALTHHLTLYTMLLVKLMKADPPSVYKPQPPAEKETTSWQMLLVMYVL